MNAKPKWLGKIKPGLHVEPGCPPFEYPCGPDCKGWACSNYTPGAHERATTSPQPDREKP